MRRVPRRVEDIELAVAHADHVAVMERSHSFLIHGLRGSEELPHLSFTPHAGRARDESRGVHEMRRPALVHPHRGRREARRELTDAAGMVEMDVGEDDVRECVRLDPQAIEGGGDGLDGCPRAGFHQRRFGGIQEVRGGVARLATHERVDRGDAVGDGEGDGRPFLHRVSLAGVCRWRRIRSARGREENSW